MKRIDQIMAHPLFKEAMCGIEDAEQDRIFCRHGMEHCLDVARILYIMVLERNLPYRKDMIYATALLHDIGRDEEYRGQVSHHEAGGRLAKIILSECGFSQEEVEQIVQAICKHKDYNEEDDTFSQLLYRADKVSRGCYSCKAGQECYWNESKRNRTVQY